MNPGSSGSPLRKGVMLALSLAALATLTGATAMADVTRVIIDNPAERPIVTNGDVSIGLFRPTLVLQDYPPVGVEVIENSMRIGFYFEAGVTSGGIVGNHLPFPAFPLQSPSLFADGGLELLGMELDSSGTWFSPSYDSVYDDVTPAMLQQVNEFGNFQIQNFNDGDMAYIGYADADRRRFGYVQIQRQSLTQWTLIGHAYGEVGEPVLVEDLTTYIPVPPSALLLGAGSALLSRRQRLDR
ncbi:MAG: hypothetical protein KF838_13460 [Phycisphaeraceae bacterium]|nr:MAG: hypothetical protein KF838_13460 [Phycisphaeraceae bacterium]